MDTRKIIDILKSKNLDWNRVDEMPCIHTFVDSDRYFVNLCLWRPNGMETITIDVDDITTKKNNVVYYHLTDEEADFGKIKKVYIDALSSSKNIGQVREPA